MAQEGIKFTLKIGPKGTADGAGDATTALVSNENLFYPWHAGKTIHIGAEAAVIDTVVDSKHATLAVAKTWADGAVIQIDPYEIAEQRDLSTTHSTDSVDVTVKSSNKIAEMIPSWQAEGINCSGLYVPTGANLADLIMAIINETYLECEITNGEDDTDSVTGEILVQSVSVGAQLTDAQTIQASFQVNGALS